MSEDRAQIEAIKRHFARKSSAQLQGILESNDPQQWSVEAFVAARELLQERAAGNAAEPVKAEEPRWSADPYSLAFLRLAVLGGLPGLIVFSALRPDDAEADVPVPFGRGTAWLALDTTDTEAVAAALELRETQPMTWAEGIKAAEQGAVFVTPPLADWTLATSKALFPPDRADRFVKPLLERLSRRFGDAQYFCTHQPAELHVWAQARDGRLVRGYGWLGEKKLTLWDEGARTKAERDLGFWFVSGQDRAGPDEGCVMQVAALWSIAPTSLDEQYREPVSGVLGRMAPSEGRSG